MPTSASRCVRTRVLVRCTHSTVARIPYVDLITEEAT